MLNPTIICYTKILNPSFEILEGHLTGILTYYIPNPTPRPLTPLTRESFKKRLEAATR